MRNILCATMTLAALGLAGCLDLDEEYTLNPDGSGKVAVRMVYAPFQLDLGGKKGDPAKAMKDSVRKELEESKGVDVWKDVSAELRTDGKVAFQGTAYFKDVQALKLHAQGFDAPMGRPSLKIRDDGRLEITFIEDKGKDKAGKPPQAALMDEEVKKKMQAERAEYQQGRVMMAPFMSSLKVRIRMHPPGVVEDAGSLQKEPDGSVSMSLEGAKLLEVLDASMADDQWLARQIREKPEFGKDGPDIDDAIIEKLLGRKGAARAIMAAGAKPPFDYAAESAAAKAAYPELLKKLDLAVAAPLPPVQGGGLRSVRVAGARIVHEADPQNGLMPLNANEPGLTYSLVAELPGRILKVNGGKLQTVTADDGSSLLPERDWDRDIHFSHLSEDGGSILFDVSLALPPKGVKALREISGTLEYSAGGKTREVDLGIADFAAGAKGKEFGAEIKSIGKSEWQEGSQNLELKLSIAVDTIESAVFSDAGGKPLEVNRSGSMSFGDETELTFSIAGAFPKKGRIVLRVYADLQRYEAPFKLEDVPLLGR